MNLVAAVFLTLTLVVLPANPAYGAAGAPAGHERSASRGVPSGPSASPGVTGLGDPAPEVYAPPVGGAHRPEGVARGFDAPDSAWGAGHRGVDLAAAAGSEVRSPGPGTVTFAGTIAGRGVVVVAHADGLRSSLEPVAGAVPVGTVVTAGDRVGTVEKGSPGHCAPGSCVHWGVRHGERYVDPLSLLRPARPAVVLLPDG
ncbi:murein hydrolase activator EnvC family protein [Myceligenerans xiligouense]|uniref:Peptidase M23-like protein n=1 Tax=Myceligenerans xiligouense TaxID=253184 RepID=A0A3N4YRY2_9MICO|nr:M23 family metallopeptidase [Myceligenerans xiligouense]RPF22144.1 peptidase M23-like protein [Myceligenerans xiligouense]